MKTDGQQFLAASLTPNGSTRIEKFEGRDHIVAPVRMMVEGVHQGLGLPPLLHTADELEKSVPLWNGQPIVIQHPLDADGMPISANAASILEGSGTGRIFNAKFENGGLTAEVWADLERIKRISPQALAGLRAMNLEVSIGSWFGVDETPGTFNNEPFAGTVHSYRPDHLALLPGEVGACSIEKGCGIRANAAGKCPSNCDKRVSEKPEGPQNTNINANTSAIVKAFEGLKALICSCGGKCHDKDLENNANHFAEVTVMKTERKELVDALIANTGSKWAEDQRGLLEGLPDDQFEGVAGLAAMQVEPEKKKPEVKPEAPDFASMLDGAPQHVKDGIAEGQRLVEEKRATLTTGIMANAKSTFTEDQLKAMPMAALEQTASLAAVPAPDYSLQGGNFAVLSDGGGAGEPLVVPVLGKKGGND